MNKYDGMKEQQAIASTVLAADVAQSPRSLKT